ncbi:MAG: ATP-binding protein [Treponema sp.]|nr:ATP-binding protein [Treponema sp.]
MKEAKNRLAARFRNINMLFVVYILITIIAVSTVMISNLADSASKSSVHSYTMETAHILSSYLNREITLVRQAAETREIIEWFADEDNLQKKYAAFHRMMHFADMLQIGGVYFVISDSLDEYSIDSGASFEKFAPFDVLNKDSLYDQWFFEALNSNFDFTLNLDVDKVTDTRRIWINYKVMDNGKPLGILCSALQFDVVFTELFSLYDSESVIGYIVDENGFIQISSYVPEPDLMQTDYTIYDIDEERHILDVLPDTSFVYAINALLENQTIHYSPRVETNIVKINRRFDNLFTLSGRDYQYMSIAPIPNTNWYTVTFFSPNTLFDITSILIPIIIVVFAFIIYVLLSSLLIQRLVFRPLYLFTKSVSEAVHGNLDIYGISRVDEIGELARTAKETWSRLNENTAALKHRDYLLETVNQTANILLSSEFEQFTNSLHHCMGLIASAIDVERVRIWKNHEADNRLYCTQLYEWSEGAEPQQGNKFTISISYDKNIPGWEQILSRGDCINNIVSRMSEEEQLQLSSQGVLSLLVVPVFLNEQFWGFVGYDSCNKERLFTESEEAIMRSTSILLSNALIRHDITQNLRDTAAKLEIARNDAETASRSKSVFLANMSHEIRTPMNAILGVTEILIEYETLPLEIEEGLDKIYSSCDMLLGIINDILDFSKIEAGKLDIIPAQYKIASLLNDSAQLNVMRINGKPIEFELHIDENLPAKLIGDEIRIKQILNNLLSNAFKYTETGKVILSAECKRGQEENGIILELKVKDTGHGMTEEQLGKLFDEYSRFNDEKYRAVEGTGLGLAITQRLTNLMNGEINVESEYGVGSLFTVNLPQEKVDDEVLGKELTENLRQFRMNYMVQRKRSKVIRDPMPYGSVLIVDDVETNLYVAAGLMKLYRLQIDTVMSGQEAIERVRSGKTYDVIFMDHMMPEMDGIEAAKKIRECESAESVSAKIPIVALTANAVAGQADIFMQNGFDDFISKPIDIRQLNSVLNKYVRDKQPQEVIDEARNRNYINSSNGNGTHNYDLKIDPMLIESFIRDARKAVSVLEDFKNSASLDTGIDLQKFTVTVHGMKSSLWNIGETMLSELAHKLEDAARNKNTGFIAESANNFSAELSVLLKKYEKKYGELTAGGITDENEDINDIINKLQVIEEMCGDYNRKGVLDFITGINKCSTKTKAVMDEIKEFVIHSEFDKAVDSAASYKKEISAN